MKSPKEITKEGNELIAKFLGWFKEEGHSDTWYEIIGYAKVVAYSEYKDQFSELPFHKDWNYLMMAVNKIEKTNRVDCTEYYPYCVTMWKDGCTISDGNNGNKIVHLFSGTTKHDAVWKAVTEFIKWYNDQTLSNNHLTKQQNDTEVRSKI
jgi:hypothetical protein